MVKRPESIDHTPPAIDPQDLQAVSGGKREARVKNTVLNTDDEDEPNAQERDHEIKKA